MSANDSFNIICMTLSHLDLVIRLEALLLAALVEGDKTMLVKLCHSQIVFTNEVGKTVAGIENLEVLNPAILRFNIIESLDRDIRFFGSVAIVNTLEKRGGTYFGLPFLSDYHLTRAWKYEKGWKLIATTSMMPC